MIWKVVTPLFLMFFMSGCDSFKPMNFPDPMENSPGLFSGPKGKFELTIPATQDDQKPS